MSNTLTIEDTDLTWRSLVGRTLAERDRPSHRIAALRQGVHAATELGAMPYTEAYFGRLAPRQRAGARRGVAICAKHTGTRQVDREGPRLGLGSSLRLLHRDATGAWPGHSESRNQIESQVASLTYLDLESTASVLDGLVGRCGEAGVVVDFFDVTRTLVDWGDGATPESRVTRARVITHFYSPIPERN